MNVLCDTLERFLSGCSKIDLYSMSESGDLLLFSGSVDDININNYCDGEGVLRDRYKIIKANK